MQEQNDSSRLPAGKEVCLSDLVTYQEGSIVSRTLIKSSGGTVTLFAFSAGQGLSEHTAPFDAMVQVLDGEAELEIGGKKLAARKGQTVLMPANIPHAVNAPKPFKMLLTMIREL